MTVQFASTKSLPSIGGLAPDQRMGTETNLSAG